MELELSGVIELTHLKKVGKSTPMITIGINP
jgi:hypothetical protein